MPNVRVNEMPSGARLVELNVTTAANGSGNVTVALERVGLLYAVEWIDGDFANGVDAVLSAVSTPSGVDKTLLTLTNADNDAIYYPRALEHGNTGTELATTTKVLVDGSLKLAVTNGGDTKTGGCNVYLLDA